MKTIGTYLITGLYFLLGVGLSFFIPAFSEVYASTYVNPWPPEGPLAPFFWPAYVCSLFFGVCAFLLCLIAKARLPPKTRKHVNIAVNIVVWLVFFTLVLQSGLGVLLYLSS
jgi:hypothetical protein